MVSYLHNFTLLVDFWLLSLFNNNIIICSNFPKVWTNYVW